MSIYQPSTINHNVVSRLIIEKPITKATVPEYINGWKLVLSTVSKFHQMNVRRVHLNML